MLPTHDSQPCRWWNAEMREAGRSTGLQGRFSEGCKAQGCPSVTIDWWWVNGLRLQARINCCCGADVRLGHATTPSLEILVGASSDETALRIHCSFSNNASTIKSSSCIYPHNTIQTSSVHSTMDKQQCLCARPAAPSMLRHLQKASCF